MSYGDCVKTYREFCSVARSLDVIGDRWALLVIRELLLGPRRFTDLLHGLPGIGTNVLSTRLRELEVVGLIERRVAPAPTPVMLYELTQEGRELRPVIRALARFGSRRMTRPAPGEAVEPRWFVLSVAANLDSAQIDEGSVFELHVDAEVFSVAIEGGEATARDHGVVTPSATLRGSLGDFFAASRGDQDAVRRLTIEGDRHAGRRFVRAMVSGSS